MQLPTTMRRLLPLLLAAAVLLPALFAAAKPVPGLQVTRVGHHNDAHHSLYKGHHSFMSPFFRAFVHNQRRSFPFPKGKECEQDAHRLCGGVLRRCVGRFACSMQCLTDHAPDLSPKCAAAHPCYSDIQKMCAHVHGGQNSMMACLHKRQGELSPECKRHHPCLTPKQHTCHHLNYNLPPADFIGNVAHFLEKVHSGAFMQHHPAPFGGHHGFFHPGGFSSHPNQHHLRMFQNHAEDKAEAALRRERQAMNREEGEVRSRERHVEAEEREILAERKELRKEHKELAHERKELLRARAEVAPASSAMTIAITGLVLAGLIGGVIVWNKNK